MLPYSALKPKDRDCIAEPMALTVQTVKKYQQPLTSNSFGLWC